MHPKNKHRCREVEELLTLRREHQACNMCGSDADPDVSGAHVSCAPRARAPKQGASQPCTPKTFRAICTKNKHRCRGVDNPHATKIEPPLIQKDHNMPLSLTTKRMTKAGLANQKLATTSHYALSLWEATCELSGTADGSCTRLRDRVKDAYVYIQAVPLKNVRSTSAPFPEVTRLTANRWVQYTSTLRAVRTEGCVCA